MGNRGQIIFKDERALAVFIGRLIETSTAVFDVEYDITAEAYVVRFSGGY